MSLVTTSWQGGALEDEESKPVETMVSAAVQGRGFSSVLESS